MAKTGSSGAFLFGAALVLGGVLAAGCEPAVPASPSYEADVRPIFMSHCVRCHGAGGMLNMPRAPVPDGGIGNTSIVADCYLNQYVNTGNCLANDPASPCHYGALTWAMTVGGGIGDVVHGRNGQMIMPPSPASPLDDWELKIIDAWVAEKPLPACSNSANPDPTICPPAAADAGQ
jgi:hypothetical protein